MGMEGIIHSIISSISWASFIIHAYTCCSCLAGRSKEANWNYKDPLHTDPFYNTSPFFYRSAQSSVLQVSTERAVLEQHRTMTKNYKTRSLGHHKTLLWQTYKNGDTNETANTTDSTFKSANYANAVCPTLWTSPYSSPRTLPHTTIHHTDLSHDGPQSAHLRIA